MLGLCNQPCCFECAEGLHGLTGRHVMFEAEQDTVHGFADEGLNHEHVHDGADGSELGLVAGTYPDTGLIRADRFDPKRHDQVLDWRNLITAVDADIILFAIDEADNALVNKLAAITVEFATAFCTEPCCRGVIDRIRLGYNRMKYRDVGEVS